MSNHQLWRREEVLNGEKDFEEEMTALETVCGLK
jgi:hypothetical protein